MMNIPIKIIRQEDTYHVLTIVKKEQVEIGRFLLPSNSDALQQAEFLKGLGKLYEILLNG